MNNSYKFSCFLNGKLIAENMNLNEFPKISADNYLQSMIIGQNLIGKLSSFLLF